MDQQQPNSQSSPSTLKRKLQCSFCCFGKNNDHAHAVSESISSPHHHRHHHHRRSSSTPCSPSTPSSSAAMVSNSRLARSSTTTWMKSRAHELPELKDKCKSLISRIGGHHSRRRSDFKYDALSYSLNFDQANDDDNYLDDSPLRCFSSRLPHSPTTSFTHRLSISSPLPPETPTTATATPTAATTTPPPPEIISTCA